MIQARLRVLVALATVMLAIGLYNIATFPISKPNERRSGRRIGAAVHAPRPMVYLVVHSADAHRSILPQRLAATMQ
jgi:hypothetical protein